MKEMCCIVLSLLRRRSFGFSHEHIILPNERDGPQEGLCRRLHGAMMFCSLGDPVYICILPLHILFSKSFFNQFFYGSFYHLVAKWYF